MCDALNGVDEHFLQKISRGNIQVVMYNVVSFRHFQAVSRSSGVPYRVSVSDTRGCPAPSGRDKTCLTHFILSPCLTFITFPFSPRAQVVVEGIPCQFSLEAEVKNFDLVFMAEHSPGDDATAPDAANDERKNGEQTAPAAKPVEEVEVDKVVMSAAASTDAVRAKTETEAPASTIDTIEEAELQVASTGNTIDSSGSSVESGAQPVIDGSVVAIEPPVSGANQAVVEVEAVTAGVGNAVETVVGDEAVDTIEGKGEASPLTEGEIAADTTSVDAVKSEGDLKGEKPGVIEGGVSASDGVLSGAAVEKEPAKRMGCSTVTTPLVVPSTELDMKSTEGQWRFLEVPPESEFVNGAIEVTKGVRFSTSLEGHNKMEDEVSETPFGRRRGSRMVALDGSTTSTRKRANDNIVMKLVWQTFRSTTERTDFVGFLKYLRIELKPQVFHLR